MTAVCSVQSVVAVDWPEVVRGVSVGMDDAHFVFLTAVSKAQWGSKETFYFRLTYSQISGPQSREYEDDSLLECCTV
jgi:hypothetical protein